MEHDDAEPIARPINKTLDHMNEAELRVHAGFLEHELLAEKRAMSSALAETRRVGDACSEVVRLRERDFQEYRKEVAFQNSLAHALGMESGAEKADMIRNVLELMAAQNKG